MQDKIVLITGGTGGIGKETAKGLAKHGARVVVTGRNRERGEAAVAEIQQVSGNPKVELLLADMSSQAEIQRLVDDFASRHDRLDVLVNNVGYLPPERWTTVDGVEATLAVNVVAPFLLTHLLLPTLKAGAPSRVINVTGGLPMGRIDFENLQAKQSFRGLTTYGHAKKVMMAMSYEFARRLDGTGVTLNVAYPGAAGTDMTANMTPDMMPLIMRLMWPLFQRFMAGAKPADAAVSSIYLASSPEAEGASGSYYNTNAKQAKWPKNLVQGDVPQRAYVAVEALVDQEKVKV